MAGPVGATPPVVSSGQVGANRAAEMFLEIFLDSAPHFGNHKSDLTTIRTAARLWRSCRRATRPPSKMSLAVGWFQTWLLA